MRARIVAAIVALFAAVAVFAAPAANASIIESVVIDDSRTEFPEGTRYYVTPSQLGRDMDGRVSSYNADTEMTEHGIPITETLARQLFCHVIADDSYGPGGKPTWNLEDWRPVVSDWDMYLTKCNP